MPNVVYLQTCVEELPSELDGIADEVHVHFPWGSLLRAMATGDPDVLENLRRICSSGALLEVVIGLDDERDRSEIERLRLQPMTTDYVGSHLAASYAKAGFEIFEKGVFLASEWPRLQSSWSKHLKGSRNRELIYFIAWAVEK